MLRNLHVNYTDEGEWAIKFSGDRYPISTLETQAQAITSAKQMAKSEKCELIIHGENGEVQEKLSYN